jgi:predicted MPP superfamily phosphohydrolase
MATTADWIIAYSHHPPYSKGLLHDSDEQGREIEMRHNALPILEELAVDLVLSGHSHKSDRTKLLDGH